MKSFSINRYYSPFSFFICFIFLNSCNLFHKNVDPSLPPITMEGKNTFGCLINGKVWIPTGDHYSPPVSADFTSGKIISFNAFSTTPSILFGIKKPNVGIFSLRDTSIAKVFYYEKKVQNTISCTYEPYHVFDGSLIITKFDMKKSILSGTFQFSTYNPSCGDTIKVTQGRFDIGNIAF